MFLLVVNAIGPDGIVMFLFNLNGLCKLVSLYIQFHKHTISQGRTVISNN